MRLADLLLCSGNTTHLTTYNSMRSTSRLTDTSYARPYQATVDRLTSWITMQVNPTFFVGQWIADFSYEVVSGALQYHNFSFPTSYTLSDIEMLNVRFNYKLDSGEYRQYNQNISPSGGRVELYHLTQNVAYIDIRVSQGVSCINTVWEYATYNINKGATFDNLIISVASVRPSAISKTMSRLTSFLTTRYSFISSSRWTTYLTAVEATKEVEDL